MRRNELKSFRAALFRAFKARPLEASRRRAPLYAGPPETSTPAAQLDAINAAWREARLNIPYYKTLQAGLLLPDAFRSLDEYREKMPLLTKEILRKKRKLFNRPGGEKSFTAATSGSTGEPVRIRFWKSEAGVNASSSLLARRWFGIVPGDRLFLVWGNPRLLRSGPAARAADLKRRAADRILGYHRENAFLLDDRSLDGILDRLLRFQPDYLAGYSAALYLMARRLLELGARAPLKAAFPTAETFPVANGADAVADAFQCPVAMEYGSVEAGVIAHEHPSGGYRVFHDTHFLETLEGEPAGSPVAVTKLYPAYIPMFRYLVGDLITGEEGSDGSVFRFERVLGRSRDVIEFADGSRVHPGAVSQVLREFPSILQFQLESGDGRPKAMKVAVKEPLKREERDEIRRRLERVGGELASIPLVEVKAVEKTAAGKSPWLIEE